MAETGKGIQRYPREIRERAVRMVLESIDETGQDRGTISRIAKQLGIQMETLRRWVRDAQVEMGQRSGVSKVEKERIKKLEREVFELRRSNEILKTAAVFFARELDPPHKNS